MSDAKLTVPALPDLGALLNDAIAQRPASPSALICSGNVAALVAPRWALRKLFLALTEIEAEIAREDAKN